MLITNNPDILLSNATLQKFPFLQHITKLIQISKDFSQPRVDICKQIFSSYAAE